MIAANILGYYWIDGKKNLADNVSKHCTLALSTDMEITETIIILFWTHTRSVEH
jgi:hypothetical protein